MKFSRIQINEHCPCYTWLIIQRYIFCIHWSTKPHQQKHNNNKCLFNVSSQLYNVMIFHQKFMDVCYITNINSIIINRKMVRVYVQSRVFSCYQLKNLLKYFQNTIDMALFQSLLVWTDRFLYHYHTKKLLLAL